MRKLRGVRFGRPPKPLPSNFYKIYQKWKEGKITGIVAADACGMPVSTFLYKARAYEKVEKIKKRRNYKKVYFFVISSLFFIISYYKYYIA